jgi:hypothetical protein
MRFLLILIAPIALAACGHDSAPPPETIGHLVATPCAKPRPEPVQPLSEQFSKEEWLAFSPKQKSALVAAQGLKRQTYGDELDVATKACPEIAP